MTGLLVRDGGLLTTVQDLGRVGFQRFGVPVCGALDRDSHRLANALVGNPPGAAALEIRYLGPVLEALCPARVALAGAEARMILTRARETETVPAGRTLRLEEGDRLAIGPLSGSVTATLAIAGGVQTAPVLGSAATFARSGFGGLDGRALRAGDRIPVALAEGPDLALAQPMDLALPARIKVVLGPQDDHFTAEAVETLLSAPWTVTQQADRMGLRLVGPVLAHRDGYNITSDGIVTGAIQVPGNGLPILLLADRQTSGGYPKIATVVTGDLAPLGRVAPGAVLRFAAVSPAEGAAHTRARETALAQALATITPPPREGLDLDALYAENLITPPILPD
ncbi:MAG: biotin-dependent carboxyltransferase family protein [Pseudomonadota bacterium]